MKLFVGLAAALATLAAADLALAHGNVSCAVPKAERKPQLELQRMLKAKGWTVRKVQFYNGCYEVYGFNPQNQSIEAIFHPGTFELLQSSR